MQPMVLVELNEVSFDFAREYAAQGRLPSFATLIARHGLGTTTSETAYENIEPWIQWVSAHTGKTFDEHRVFRLGDIVGSNVQQIWEILECRGVSVGAVSPMNATNRLNNPAFFVPDPWTRCRVT